MKILAIDTSCDETAVAVTEGTKILSNIVWSQASLHAKWGGVVPSIAKREHEERINWVIEKALKKAFPKSHFIGHQLLVTNIDAVAVTVGPGLAIALEVGIKKAKELSIKFNKPFIPVNHVEGHLLSPLARPGISKQINNSGLNIKNLDFPVLGVVTSGGHTEVVWIKTLGDYKIIAQTSDDALGESLDKAARLLDFGYPGGEILEINARQGNPYAFDLPIPMLGREKEMYFSYSGLKAAFVRLVKEVSSKKDLTPKDISNLAASYQHVAFTHFIRVLDYLLKSNKYSTKNILAGGGVMANGTLRKMLRQVAKKNNLKVLVPYSKRLNTDNAAMIGVAAYFRFKRKEILKPKELAKVDRIPRAKVDEPFAWER